MAWLAVAVSLAILAVVNSEEVVVCPHEGQQIKCTVSQVIVVKSAIQGRLPDRTLCGYDSTKYSCKADVFSEVDRWCTGVQFCFLDEGFTFHLGDGSKIGCPWGTPKYLVVEYDCIDVVMPSVPSCDMSAYSPTIVTAGEGYIASQVTYNTDCGHEYSPWIVRVPKGYRIEMEIIDPQAENSHARTNYGNIRESDVDMNPFFFGRGRSRNRPLYRSQTNSVQIQVENNPHTARFILHYRAFIHVGDRIRYLAVSAGTHLKSVELYLLLSIVLVRYHFRKH